MASNVSACVCMYVCVYEYVCMNQCRNEYGEFPDGQLVALLVYCYEMLVQSCDSLTGLVEENASR